MELKIKNYLKHFIETHGLAISQFDMFEQNLELIMELLEDGSKDENVLFEHISNYFPDDMEPVLFLI